MKEPSPSANPVRNQGVTPASAFDTGGVAIVEYDLKFCPNTFNFSLSNVDLLLRLRQYSLNLQSSKPLGKKLFLI